MKYDYITITRTSGSRIKSSMQRRSNKPTRSVEIKTLRNSDGRMSLKLIVDTSMFLLSIVVNVDESADEER
jgi:hypothetical protein